MNAHVTNTTAINPMRAKRINTTPHGLDGFKYDSLISMQLLLTDNGLFPHILSGHVVHVSDSVELVKYCPRQGSHVPQHDEITFLFMCPDGHL